MRVLVCLPEPESLAAELKQRRPELEVRARTPRALGAADLDWAEVFFGFRKPPVRGWGNIRWAHSIGAGVDGLLQTRRPARSHPGDPVARGLRAGHRRVLHRAGARGHAADAGAGGRAATAGMGRHHRSGADRRNPRSDRRNRHGGTRASRAASRRWVVWWTDFRGAGRADGRTGGRAVNSRPSARVLGIRADGERARSG